MSDLKDPRLIYFKGFLFLGGGCLASALLMAEQPTLKVAFYRQRASWQLGGDGSPGLEPFSARWIEAGIAKSF